MTISRGNYCSYRRDANGAAVFPEMIGSGYLVGATAVSLGKELASMVGKSTVLNRANTFLRWISDSSCRC